MLLCVDFGELEVDNGLEQLDNGAPKVRLYRETHGWAILNLNVEAGDGFAAFIAANLNPEVKLVGGNLALNHVSLIGERLAALNLHIASESVPILRFHA